MIYEIAFHLKMPVYQLIEEMPYEEILGWQAFFEIQPPGWQEDNRAFKLLQAQGVKAKPGEVFPSLAKIMKPRDIKHTDGMLEQPELQGTSLLGKLMAARGGEKLPYDESQSDG
jgi:hypothetical protein